MEEDRASTVKPSASSTVAAAEEPSSPFSSQPSQSPLPGSSAGAPETTPSSSSSSSSSPEHPAKKSVLLKKSTTHGLSFLALLAFVVSFLSARTFATLNPSKVVKEGGIHFHHFWYGLTMVIIVGWVAIAYDIPRYRRIYAVVFGLGCGLIGDEIGLFLTMSNYNSSLTFFFFVIVVSIGSIVVLLRDRESLRYDVIELEVSEILLLLGIVVMGVSTLAFATGLFIEGVVIVGGGAIVAVVGLALNQTKSQ
jgi:hypothetical protein